MDPSSPAKKPPDPGKRGTQGPDRGAGVKVTGGEKSKVTNMAGSSNQSSVPPEVVALQNPLSPEAVTCHRNPSGVIVPKIMKRGDHCYAEHVPQVQVATCATAMEAAEADLKSLPWKQYHPDTLKRYVCAVACCAAPFPPDVSFHAIPKNPAVRKAWVAACKRKDSFNPNKSYVCSQHFKEEDIERDLRSELMNKEKKERSELEQYHPCTFFQVPRTKVQNHWQLPRRTGH